MLPLLIKIVFFFQSFQSKKKVTFGWMLKKAFTGRTQSLIIIFHPLSVIFPGSKARWSHKRDYNFAPSHRMSSNSSTISPKFCSFLCCAGLVSTNLPRQAEQFQNTSGKEPIGSICKGEEKLGRWLEQPSICHIRFGTASFEFSFFHYI